MRAILSAVVPVRLAAVTAALTVVAASVLVAVPAHADPPVDSLASLQTALQSTGSYTLTTDLSDTNLQLSVSSASAVTVDLAGHDVSLERISLGVGSTLTITDSSDTGAGTLTVNASQADGLAAIHSLGAIFEVTGSANVVATGGSNGAGIGGDRGEDAGVTRVSGTSTVDARGGEAASAIGAGYFGTSSGQSATGGQFTLSGSATVTVHNDSQSSAIGSFSNTGQVDILSGTLIIAADSWLSLALPNGARFTNNGTIVAVGAIIGVGPIVNGKNGSLTGDVSEGTAVHGASYVLDFDADGGIIDSGTTPMTVTAATVAAALQSLPTAHKSGYVLSGWAYNSTLITANTSLADAIGYSQSQATQVTLVAVWRIAADVAVELSPGSITFGGTTSITATAVPGDIGSFEFFADGVSLGSAAATGGMATFVPTAVLAAGTHMITAKFSGDSSGTGTAGLTVARASSTVAVALAATSIPSGSLSQFSAVVAAPGATGSVQFWVDGSSIGTRALSSGSAVISAGSALAVGAHSISATYSGDANYQPSDVSAARTLTVTDATSDPTGSPSPAPTVTVTATATPDGASAAGNGAATAASGGRVASSTAVWTSVTSAPYSAAASVSAHIGDGATGRVDFTEGGTVVAFSAVIGGFASAALPRTMAAGTHTIVARYSGDATHAGSASVASSFVVTAATTKVRVSAKKFTRSSKPKIVVKIAKLSSGEVVRGTVSLYVGKKKVKTVRVTAASTTVRLKKRYSSSIRMHAVFRGTTNVRKATSKTVTVHAK